MADQVTQILMNAQNPDISIRSEAERQLEAAKEQNFAMFLMTMVTELATEGKPETARQLAALLMKNSLFAKSETKRAELQNKWNTQLDEPTKTQVKNGCLQTLRSPNEGVRNQACQVIAKIGLCELPNGQWTEVITILKDAVITAQDQNAKHGALVALGYICQEISEQDESECLEAMSNDILTAVIQGMRKDEPDNSMNFAAVKALRNALQFAESNFSRAEERNYIMQQLCESTQCPSKEVRREAMDCLAEIAYYYYRFLPEYVQAISQLTLKAIKEDEEEVATTAMEFWSTIVDEELSLEMEAEDGSEVQIHNITKQATPFFIPVLLECLTKQKEDDDEDTWTVSKAAAVCLSLFAQCAKDDVVQYVMPFVQSNIGNGSWILQDAAVQAFGSILEGPSIEVLKPFVSQAVPHFLDQLVNKQLAVQVRDTVAWVIASILEYCTEAVPPELLNKLIERTLTSLSDEPRVAVHGCYAFQQLIAYVELNTEDEEPQTTQLSPFTQHMLTALVTTANRDDADETANGHELFTCAYSALADLVRVSGKDMQPYIAQLVPVVVQKLAATFQPPINQEPKFCHSVQGQCCAVLGTLCTKLPVEAIMPAANDMMQGLLMVFQSKNAEVHEEALMAISALALALGQHFLPYMQHLIEPLKMALENTDDYPVCAAAVGVVGDLSRALEKQMTPFCEDIFLRLMQLLMNQMLHRSVKPPILSTFGDIALAIGGSFHRFLEHAMTMLYNASQIQLDADPSTGLLEEEDQEYMNKLRENILEGYSGIVQALRDADKTEPGAGGKYVNSMQTYLPNVVYLMEKRIYAELALGNPDLRDPAVVRATLNLLGDLAQALPAAKPYFANQWVRDMLTVGQQMAQAEEIDMEDVQFGSKILS